MASIGIAFFETGIAWFWPKWRLQNLYTIEGLEHLQAAQESKVGVILMAFHFTHIDIGAKLLGLRFSIDGTYRPHNNPVYDYIQRTGRERHSMHGQAIPRDDVRAMVKALRTGRAIWYAPDQDYGPKHSIFVPLFGVPAATVTATSQLARLGKARVIAFTQTRRKGGAGYHLKIYPPLEHFPSEDEVVDTQRINRFVEERILEQPEQYLWVHRRFKTRPEGAPDLYALAGVVGKKRDSD
jgi:KDO2-lipid IV(A) lauroyltransferase